MKRTQNHSSLPAIARRAKEGRSGAAAGLARRSAKRVGGHGLRSAKREGAFTLVELLVVIAIIGVLAGLTYPAVNLVIERGRKSATQGLVNAIDSGLEMFKTDFGHVPYNNDDGTGKIPGAVFGRQEYVRLWLLGLDKDGEPDGTHASMSSRAVRGNGLWNGDYVEIKIDRNLDKDNEDCAYCFIDSWGNPLYFEFYDAVKIPGDERRNKPIFNMSKWDVWSKGPDEEGTEDMRAITGSTYEKRRENWQKETEDGKEINRDNVVNK